MSNTGKKLTALLLAVLTLSPGLALAEVTVTVDRNSIALGDTLRLTITADDGENVKDADLRPVLAEFEILQRSSSSNYSLVNGRGSRTEQLQLDLSPKREGVLRIPPMRVGKGVTNAIEVDVSSAPDVATGGQPVLFEATVDTDTVYVQGQAILTLRLQQAINLDNRSVSEFTLDNVFVSKLEQKSFQRTIDGRQWLVHEIRYALFPEQSGTLEIPAQTFSARVSGGRRTLFDRAGSGRLIRRNSEALSIEVLPIPTGFQGQSWLPARQLSITEHWSTPPEQLRAGESATRTIRIQGEGVQGAQLPPTLFTPIDGLKFYPDQPQIADQEISTGIMGTRTDSAAVVPTRAGTWTLPEIRVAWWDTQAEQLRYATLPQREISVAAADPSTINTGTVPEPMAANTHPGATTASGSQSALPWQLLALFTSLGWLCTAVWFWWRGRDVGVPRTDGATSVSNRRALKVLLGACSANDAAEARRAVITWASALNDRADFASLGEVSAWFASEDLAGQLQDLESALYGETPGNWSGASLARCIQALPGPSASTAAGNEELRLYPESG